MMDWGYGMGGTGWLMMIGFWLLVVVALAGAAAWIFPGRTHGGTAPRSPSARDILDQRLASHDIDIETYRTIRDELIRSEQARNTPNHTLPR